MQDGTNTQMHTYMENEILVVHGDVIRDEATEEQSISKRPMFGTTFPTYS